MKSKKSKRGFTLIELLAVIIVIIIIISITIPLVAKVKEIVKREAFRATAYSIADAGRLLIANENESQGYQEFYYQNSIEYNADGKKLDYSGKGPKTGVVILNENNKVVLAIHNGTYCAIKSANTNKVTVTKTAPDDCNAYSIIETCDTWQQIAIKYDVSLADLLAANDETDSNSSTCGREINIPVSSNSSSSSSASGTTVYYKTYYTVGYVSSSATLPLSYDYTIKLGVLPLDIADIEVTRVTAQSVFETLDDFKRYITKKNMGEVIWQGENSAPIDISQASVFRDHAAKTSNMTADDVSVMCDTEACYATVSATVNNLTNVNPNTIEGVGQVAYTPIKFTVEFNGEGESCAVRTTTDAVPGTLAGTGAVSDPYLVESIEDLVALSNSVNAGNNYSGKYISLTNSFDFKNKRSYKDFSTTTYGDINGNGTTEGLLTELTTGAGFVPIGNNSTRFAGKLLGNSGCIFNLYINRPTTPYVGLVGYNGGGTITALTLTDINITGSDYTGGLAGVTESSVTDSNVTGNITGNNYVGLAVGNSGNTTVTGITVEGNITGADVVGGITGNMSDSTSVRGINKGGSIVATGGNVGRIVGATYYGWGSRGGLAMSSVTINGSTVNSTDGTSTNGATINSMAEITDINLAEMVYDTYIGGDNDGNGYYWDYDNTTGNLVRKSTADSPITFNLAGAGTSADPYLISNYDELKQASLKTNVVYKLTSNIDLTGKHFYMLGSHANPFTGTIDGNTKTISNIVINASTGSYIGLVGLNRGFITNITLEDISIAGGNLVGGLAGQTENRITDSNVSGNITGINYLGLAAGNTGNTSVTGITVEGNITGVSYVGGLTGCTSDSTTARGIYKGGSIVATGGSIGRMVGGTYYGWGTRGLLVDSSVTVNGSAVASTDATSTNGSSFDSMADLNDINVAEIALDTYIGGDNDGNGYYWDYNGTGTLTHKSVADYPLTFSLSGSGTTADPYLIANYADLRQASLRVGSVFKLTSDINLSGQNYYMIGSHSNPFTGTFDGNMKTISNLTMNASKGSFLGLVGFNRGLIMNVTMTNATIHGNSYVGGLAGHTENRIIDSNVDVDITGNNYLGLATGNTGNTSVTGITVEGDITGVSYVGGFTGCTSDSTTVRGIYKGGSIVATGGSIGRMVGGTYYGWGTRGLLVDSSVTINGSTVDSTDATSTNGSSFNSMADLNDINAAEMALDTYIGGDNDGNGYYWDYDETGTLVHKSVASSPLTFSLSGSGTSADPYLIGTYADLRQATLKLSSAYKLSSDIDLSGKDFYVIGSHSNPFTGSIDGNVKTISNLTINASKGSYLGLVGFNRGTIKGVTLNNISIDGNNCVGGIAGQTENSIVDSTVNGNITGNNNVGLAVGYGGNTLIGSIIVEGDIVGVNSVGGLVGCTSDSTTVRGIYKSGSIVATGGSIGRVVGGTYYGWGTRSGAVVSSITINGLTITSTDAASTNGLDITSSDLSNTVTYTDRGFNFTDEALDYIWYLDSGVAKFRAGSL